MDFFRSMLKYASDAWNLITGGIADVAGAFQALWHFAGSVQMLLDHLASKVFRDIWAVDLGLLNSYIGAIRDIIDALRRVGPYVQANMVGPLRIWMLARIYALNVWTFNQLVALRQHMLDRIFAANRYSHQLFMAEQTARIADVNKARAYSLQLTNALHQLIEKEAAQGYRAGNVQRLSAIRKLTDELAQRNPLIKGLVSDFVALLLDTIGAANPVERIALGFLLKRLINKLAVDRVAGDLLGRIAGPLIANPPPQNLHDVLKDLAERIGAMESQWADFMASGGPEVEQAGKEWKSYTGLAVDAALIGFFGTAVAAPQQWATGVADTLGTVVDEISAEVAKVIREA